MLFRAELYKAFGFNGLWVGGFLIPVKRPYVQLSSPDRQKG